MKPTKTKRPQNLINPEKLYLLEEAIDLVKQTSHSKFDATIEAHFNLEIDVKTGDQNIRTTVSLPHGTGKNVRVAVFSTGKVAGADLNLTEADIVSIEKGKLKPKVDFDVVAAEPSFMAKISKIAKILGPAGMMPNPKTGTVAEDLTKVVSDIKKGKVELRNEANAPIIHTKIGKKSFENKALAENFMEIFKALKASKPQKADPNFIKNCFLCSTMGPSVPLDLTTIL